MEEQCSPINWAYYYQEEVLEELKHSLLYSTLELEAAVISAHEDISSKEDEILQLKGLIAKTIKERDGYKSQCQTLLLEKHLLFKELQAKQPLVQSTSTGTTSHSSHEDEHNLLSPLSNSDENISTKDSTFTPPPPPTPPPPVFDLFTGRIAIKKPLPENGKFLQAVIEAGPLLQTLLLAGPLPQWQHPPPQLNSIDIPPVTISSSSPNTPRILHNHDNGFTNKRTVVNRELGSEYILSPKSKYQKVVHQPSLTPPTSS